MLYKDILELPRDYVPCMDAASIDRNPDTWLNFYPHVTFVDILRQILACMDGQGQSIWISGAYGTGKSHASLVLQKLFMDDEERVKSWLGRYARLIPEPVAQNLLAKRKGKTFVVYDVNADNLDGQVQFLARLQRTICATLRLYGYKVPPAGFKEQILNRVREDGPYFFAKRDEMQPSLYSLNDRINDIDALEKAVERNLLNNDYELMNDIMAVLEARNIFLPLDANTFYQWIEETLKINGISRLVYIFDEFSGFVNRNRGDLTTFQSLTQTSQQGKFFFIPVTHIALEAFTGAGTDTSRKISHRFKFMPLEMPTNIAMKLASHILQIKSGCVDEWKRQREELWKPTEALVINYMVASDNDLQPEDFRNLLPLHPMSAVVLKQLSTFVGANQRSLFAFFNDATFKKFLEIGGIDVPNHQYLTVDQLWDYFMAYADPKTEEIVREIRSEYDRQKSRLDENEKRIFIGVLLYSLLEREHGAEASHLLNASVENITRAFEGDGVLDSQVDDILEQLAKKRCLSLYNGHCYLFQDRGDTKDLEKAKQEWMDKFEKLVLKRSHSMPGTDVFTRINRLFGMSSNNSRYDIRVNGIKLNMGAYSPTDKGRFSRDGNQILLQFLFAGTDKERVELPDRAKNLANQLSGLRALIIIAPEISFCHADEDAWAKYVEAWVRYSKSDTAAKQVYEQDLIHADEEWWKRIQLASLQVWQANENGQPFNENISWNELKDRYLSQYIRLVFPANPDAISGGNITALGPVKGLQSWAQAGIDLEGFNKPGAYTQVINTWKNAGITSDPEWFKTNHEHPLARIRKTCENFLTNTGDTGCSVGKLYKKLQKPPFGLIANPHTAMCLGFALKDWISPKRGLQWTNGSASQPLDLPSLAEIIESAIKADGEKIKNEKLVFRLGPEEKAFIKAAGNIFDVPTSTERGMEGVLNLIPERLERISGKIPLWMLPYAMRQDGLNDAQYLEEILQQLSEALKISASSDTQRRTNLVRSMGSAFRDKPELVESLKNFMEPINFERAFALFIESVRPELTQLAEAIGDSSGQFRQEIKTLLAKTGSWLWNKVDVEKTIDDVYEGLKCARLMGKISGTSITSFDDAFSRLKHNILHNNHIPLIMWEEKQPAFRRLFELVITPRLQPEELRQLAALLETHEEIIRKTFFDPLLESQLTVASAMFPGLWPSSPQESRALYESLDEDSALQKEAEFKKRFSKALEDRARSRFTKKFEQIWQNRTDSDSLVEWSKRHLVPPQFAIEANSIGVAEKIAAVLLNPQNAATERLEEIAAFMEQPDSIRNPDDARSAFLDHIAYERHKTIILMAGEQLTNWLAEKLDPDPGHWLAGPGFQNCLDEFVQSSYQKTVQPMAVRKIKDLTDAQAKTILLELVQTMPDAGFYLLEKQ